MSRLPETAPTSPVFAIKCGARTTALKVASGSVHFCVRKGRASEVNEFHISEPQGYSKNRGALGSPAGTWRMPAEGATGR